MNTWFAVLELPFLLVAIIFGFLIARTVRSSKIGRGMTFIALGSLVMAIGHIIMIVNELVKEQILTVILGDVGGAWAWLVALCTSWLFYGLGFVDIYKVLPEKEVELLQKTRSHEQAREALRHSEDLYRSLVESVRDVIYTLSPDGRITSLNLAFELYTGWSRSEWIGQPFAPLVHTEDLPLAMEIFHRVMAGENPPLFTLRIREKSGNYRVGEFMETPQLRDGRVVGILGVGRDATERIKAEEALRIAHDELERRVQERTAELTEANRALKTEILERQRIEEALRESEERFRKVFEDAPIGISITDASYRLVKVNGAFCTMLGYTEEEFATKTFLDITHPDDSILSMRAAEEVFGGTVPFGFEKRYIKKTGEVVLAQVRVSGLLGDGGKIRWVVALIEDITERKRDEQARARLAAMVFEEAERRHIAHELHDQIGQMLTALKLTLELAGRQPDVMSGGKLEIAQRSVEELMKRVHDISLDLRPPMLDDLGLLPALLWFFQKYTAQTNVQVNFQHIGLERRFAQELETAAYRIVQEALNNVARHAGVKNATVRTWADGSMLGMQIEDQGIGFEVSSTPVTTLGLTGMRERVHALGGDLTVESAPGRGTRVTAELPLNVPIEKGKLMRT